MSDISFLTKQSLKVKNSNALQKVYSISIYRLPKEINAPQFISSSLYYSSAIKQAPAVRAVYCVSVVNSVVNYVACALLFEFEHTVGIFVCNIRVQQKAKSGICFRCVLGYD